MKTALLFDVPKTHPSRKEKLHAFMKLHGIQTHSVPDKFLAPNDDYPKWMAVWVTEVVKRFGCYGAKEGMSIAELGSHVGRLMDAYGYCHYGDTEAEVVEALCKDQGIVFDLEGAEFQSTPTECKCGWRGPMRDRVKIAESFAIPACPKCGKRSYTVPAKKEPNERTN